MSTPQVSVILPVYNTEGTLKDCLDSLLSQTCSSMEIVAVDDGSTDASGTLLDTYKGRYTQLRVIHVENGGVWKARKIGLQAAKGQYIGFCDSDDISLPHMYERLLHRALETEAEMVVCPFWRVDMSNGKALSTEMTQFGDKTLSPKEDPGFLPAVNTALWNKLFKASVLNDSIDFESPPRVLEDMMLQCSIITKLNRVSFIATPLYRYMVHPGSAMGTFHSNELPNITHNLVQTRDFVKSKTDDSRFWVVCDVMAFIHVGLSVLLRLVDGQEQTVRQSVALVQSILDDNFPHYKKNAYCTLRYNLCHSNYMLKPTLALWCYKTRTITPIMKLYQLASTKLGVSIKW